MEKRDTLSEAGKWIVTAYNISRIIPGCDELDHFQNEWSTWDDWTNVDEIQFEIKEALLKFIRSARADEIAEAFHLIRTDKKLKPVLIHIKHLLGRDHRVFLGDELKGIPAQLIRPIIPFVPSNRNSGTMVHVKEPFVQEVGNTKVTMENVLLFSRDAKTLLAIIKTMADKPVRNYGDQFISFRTTLYEIAKRMGVSNPYADNVQNAIWHSLTRMRACSITWENKKGMRTIGGILSKARELEEDSALEVEIYLDMEFLSMYHGGYANLNEKAMYHMSERQINAYMFFESQMDYKKTGKLQMNILKLYDRMNLATPGTDRPNYKRRRDMVELMTQCNKLGIIGRYLIKDDVLVVTSKGSLFMSSEGKGTNSKPEAG